MNAELKNRSSFCVLRSSFPFRPAPTYLFDSLSFFFVISSRLSIRRNAPRAVAAAALTAVAAPQMVARGEDYRRALSVEIFSLF
ncbi:MAG TPA: hypothetical protein VEX60_10485 [Pyrinomonadaceae bacterium]|nr:hypothetical protein [Pyrinomonadaceae bacterium]